MSLHQRILEAEADLDAFEDSLQRRHPEVQASFTIPSRGDEVPPDVLTVGLVGGTGVGKSTIINALAGQDVSTASHRRPTTDKVIPYIHADQVTVLNRLSFLNGFLTEDRSFHRIESLRALMIFDLPDVDSNQKEHARVVDNAMKGLDLVIWVTSVTKYADKLFHDWIRRYAATKNLDNFFFLVNKVDEISLREGNDGPRLLLDKFRDAATKSLDNKALGEPKFFSCSAQNPSAPLPGNQFQAFRDELFRERDAREILRIKSSDRLALYDNRLQHLNTVYALESQSQALRSDMDDLREALARCLDDPPTQAEILHSLEEGSAPDEVAKRIFEESLRPWPLLPHLKLLTLPIRQLGRLLWAAKVALPDNTSGDENSGRLPLLREAMLKLDMERRSQRSRLARPMIPKSPPLDRQETVRRLTALENESVAQIRDAVFANRDQGSTPDSKYLAITRHVIVWLPLLWFPLLQPLLTEILDPNDGLASMPLRLTHRLLRIMGAAHLLTSLVFVLVLYALYFLVFKAKARRKALAQCRSLLQSEWWQETLLARLVDAFASENRDALIRLETDETELHSLEVRLDELRQSLNA